MELVSPPKTRIVEEYDFYFLGGGTTSLNLIPELGDTFTREHHQFCVVKHNEKREMVDDLTIERRNLLWVSHRTVERSVLDPKTNPVTQHLDDLQKRREAVASSVKE